MEGGHQAVGHGRASDVSERNQSTQCMWKAQNHRLLGRLNAGFCEKNVNQIENLRGPQGQGGNSQANLIIPL